MTLLSDQAEDIRALVESADPGAVWAVGGPEGVHAASAGRGLGGSADTAVFPDDRGGEDTTATVRAPGDGLGGSADTAVFPDDRGGEDTTATVRAPGDGGGGGAAPGDLDVGGLATVLALWPALGSLVAEGALQLHTPLTAYGDTTSAPGTTAHHLLTHPEGTAALTRLAESLAGTSLAELAATRVWQPLGMTRTRFADGTLRAPLTDLVRFPCHLLAQDGPGVSPAWTAESLRIRTGELTPARGLLWHPAPHGVWAHHAPAADAPALWVAPRLRRWAVLLPASAHTPVRTAFREAAFTRAPAG
ncbi:hypothetical protein [Streptomyces sp. NPDC058613]|uniref:hypothetical protein n=1 Tax=Streptomyces sp. NPDC058613 TaxID=3346556 RepID=UPI003665F641